MAGPDKAIKKHILGLLSFDKNKGFTLESGHFVPSCKMHQVIYYPDVLQNSVCRGA